MIRAALMCHAPIVIPEIAGPRANQVAQTTEAMAAISEWLLGAHPDRVILISPHTPRLESDFGYLSGERLHGDFGLFGFEEIQIDLPNDEALHPHLESIILDSSLFDPAAASAKNLKVRPLKTRALDHGAMVPLYFLARQGWVGPTTVISLPGRSHSSIHWRLGAALRKCLADCEKPGPSKRGAAIIASGDMSHRLLPGAPAGFHPQAARFDREFCQLLDRGDDRRPLANDLRELAAEDVVDSFEVVTGLGEWRTQGRKLLSYEGPFGVGYLVAQLFEEDP